MPDTPLRGRRGRDRRIAERVATDFAARHPAPAPGTGVDFDIAAVDAEVEDARRPAPKPRPPVRRPPPNGPGSAGRAAVATGSRTSRRSRRSSPRPAPSPALQERLGPAGDDERRVGRHVGLVAVPHGAKSYLAAALALAGRASASSGSPGTRRSATAWRRSSAPGWATPASVAVLEPRTALAYERSELIADETAARVAALASWHSGRARVLVASVQALLQHTIDPADLPDAPRELRLGARIHQEALLRELFDLGYVPVTEVAGRGEFARRGGIVDVFPPSLSLPIRIEFFGDEIESLRAFDPTDQRTVGTIESAVLLPASEFLLPAGGASAIRDRLGRAAGRLPERLAADLERFDTEALAAGRGADASRAMAVGDAAEVWAAHLAPATGLDHIGPGTLLVLDEPGDIAEAAEFLWRQADERRAELVEAGELPEGLAVDLPAAARLEGPPRRVADPRAHLGIRCRRRASRWPAAPCRRATRSAGASRSCPPVVPGAWTRPSRRWRADGARIVLASDQAPRLADLLGEAGHEVAVVGRVGEAPPPGAIVLIERSLNGGFIGGPDGLAFVTDRELFGTVRIRRPKALRRVVPRDILERLTPGDLVVHIDHGVARYEQMLRRGGAGEDRDYLELSFAGGDRIFVPVEQIGRISRYSGGERPALSKLGGTEWLRAKQRVRKAVDDLAEELLALYASRAGAQGHAFLPDTPWQSEMEASFPYEETIDQLRASAEVKADMELTRPMDRLVVGDVGYGKTEVALRAAFKATQDGKQVAVLVPTTVLAAQHHATFSQRFAAFPLEVRLLSRFVAPAAQEATVAGLTVGTVDIVIGTHRLLSKDIRFRDLGLVVVDEEQRFGVAAKERLKQLKREVDVLTLSATPIPRTLNLALAGIRDLSVIETPPEDRLPIQTRVAEASAGLVRDAILRELDRGGQVFYVHNRVETIEAQAEQLRRMLPGVRFVVGHGQMGEGTLEKVMITFADGAADVLVCTTIIESGLDIPNANTIVIDRADTLGLAQLYQLRGRVGRSSRRAYAYLLYRRRERLSDEARKRLQAIFNASELGAGFQIALSDLEIRGAGNILGGEQSGHMAAVGFDLYSRLLAEAVETRKASMEGRAPIVEAPQAVIDLPVEAHLPDDYVPDEAQKLELYRRLRARPVRRRPGRLPPGGARPLRPDARSGHPARGGGRAQAHRGGRRRRLDLARGGLARRAVRERAHAGDRDAPARRSIAAGSSPDRCDVRQQPGPPPVACRPAQGLDAHPGGRRATVGRVRLIGPGGVVRTCRT